jgi:hypothetical protein
VAKATSGTDVVDVVAVKQVAKSAAKSEVESPAKPLVKTVKKAVTKAVAKVADADAPAKVPARARKPKVAALLQVDAQAAAPVSSSPVQALRALGKKAVDAARDSLTKRTKKTTK